MLCQKQFQSLKARKNYVLTLKLNRFYSIKSPGPRFKNIQQFPKKFKYQKNYRRPKKYINFRKFKKPQIKKIRLTQKQKNWKKKWKNVRGVNQFFYRKLKLKVNSKLKRKVRLSLKKKRFLPASRFDASYVRHQLTPGKRGFCLRLKKFYFRRFAVLVRKRKKHLKRLYIVHPYLNPRKPQPKHGERYGPKIIQPKLLKPRNRRQFTPWSLLKGKKTRRRSIPFSNLLVSQQKIRNIFIRTTSAKQTNRADYLGFKPLLPFKKGYMPKKFDLKRHLRYHKRQYKRSFRYKAYHPLRWSWRFPKLYRQKARWLKAYFFMAHARIGFLRALDSFDRIKLAYTKKSIFSIFKFKTWKPAFLKTTSVIPLKKSITLKKFTRGSLKIVAVIQKIQKVGNSYRKFFRYKTVRTGRKNLALVPFVSKKKFSISNVSGENKKAVLRVRKVKRFKALIPFINFSNKPTRVINRLKFRLIPIKRFYLRLLGFKKTYKFLKASRKKLSKYPINESLSQVNLNPSLLFGSQIKKSSVLKLLKFRVIRKSFINQKKNIKRLSKKRKILFRGVRMLSYKKVKRRHRASYVKVLRRPGSKIPLVTTLQSASKVRKKRSKRSVRLFPNPGFFVRWISKNKNKFHFKKTTYLSTYTINTLGVSSQDQLWAIKKKNRRRLKFQFNRFFTFLSGLNNKKIFRSKLKKIKILKFKFIRKPKKRNKRLLKTSLRAKISMRYKKKKKSKFIVLNSKISNKIKRRLIKKYSKKYNLKKKLAAKSFFIKKKKFRLLTFSSLRLNSKKQSTISLLRLNPKLQQKTNLILRPFFIKKIKIKSRRLRKYGRSRFHSIKSVLTFNRNRYKNFKKNLRTPYGLKLLPFLNKWRFRRKSSDGPSSRYQTNKNRKINRIIKKNNSFIQRNKWFNYKLFLRKYIQHRFLLTKRDLKYLKNLSINKISSLNHFSGLFESTPSLIIARSGLLPTTRLIPLLIRSGSIRTNGLTLSKYKRPLKPNSKLELDYSKIRIRFPRLKEHLLCRLRLWWLWFSFCSTKKLTKLQWNLLHIHKSVDGRIVHFLKRPGLDELPLMTSFIPTMALYNKLYNLS